MNTSLVQVETSICLDDCYAPSVHISIIKSLDRVEAHMCLDF